MVRHPATACTRSLREPLATVAVAQDASAFCRRRLFRTICITNSAQSACIHSFSVHVMKRSAEPSVQNEVLRQRLLLEAAGVLQNNVSGWYVLLWHCLVVLAPTGCYSCQLCPSATFGMRFWFTASATFLSQQVLVISQMPASKQRPWHSRHCSGSISWHQVRISRCMHAYMTQNTSLLCLYR